MQLNKSLKPTTDTNGALINKQDYAALSEEINELKEQIQALQTAMAGFANTVNTDNLNAVNVTADNVAGENIQAQDLSATNTLSVSNGSGQDKEIIINRNGVPRWEPADQINAQEVLVADTVWRATTVDHSGSVNTTDAVTQADSVTHADNVDHADTVTDVDVATNVTTATNISTVENVTTCDTVTNTTTVTNADTVTDADTVAHADIVQVADVIQQTGDVSIVGNFAVTGDITQGNDTLDNTYIKLTEKGTPNGVATLDNTGRIPASQLTIDAMEYKGKWDASTNTPTLADGTGTDGDFYIVSVAGSQDLGSGTISFNLNDRVLYNGSEWERVPAGQVDSVNGATGDVVLTGEDIAESTSDNLKIDRRLKNWLFVDGQGANATKTARGYFSADGIALITFDANNVYQDAFSLTINGLTCQVYLNGAPTSSANYTLPKGTYIVKFGILGLTPYYVIDTEYSVFSAREAGHAQSADSATTATSATNATNATNAGNASTCDELTAALKLVTSSTESVNLAANSSAQFNFTLVVPTGYKSIGIVGVINSGNGGTINLYSHNVSNLSGTNTTGVYLRNYSSSAQSGNFQLFVLCAKTKAISF